jgi:hypothetical protein
LSGAEEIAMKIDRSSLQRLEGVIVGVAVAVVVIAYVISRFSK